ncbi:sigma factor [Streptomyces sp. C184]|uniref:sigma factor n=1 Tax=Streptomyces sp. C184 TaxID=3237121 RepID=UPI0034C65A3C
MDEQDLLAERFERHRPRLRAVAYRVLGSTGEAEDAVQEAWLRLSRSGAGEVENLGGWLTTVVARVSLDMLRSRATRREDSWEAHRAEAAAGPAEEATGPEQQAVLADSVGLALLVVLDTGPRLALLDPEAELSTDAAAALAGVSPAHGPAAVAETFVGRAKAAQPALIGGTAGLAWAPGGTPRVVFGFTIRDGRVVAIELLADAERIGRLDLELLAG